MNRIDAMFEARSRQGRAASVFYVTAGFPAMATTERVVLALAEAGADLIELGIPFSDPIADGPTIQKASQAALEAGATVQGVLDLARAIRSRTEIPMILFTAFNPVLHYGLERFVTAARESGCDGLLVPDLPPEEAGELEPLCRAADLKLIFLAAPTTREHRRKLIAAHSTGFIYYISLRGVTGARADLPPDIEANLTALKAATSTPVVVGFGISRPEHVRQVGSLADGFVVGSALIELIERHAGSPALEDEVKSFARGLIEALPVKAPARA
jgi:tryptophan synthase alpha chain